MRGYLADPQSTKETLRDGRLWTGDLGYLADGELFITGRRKDIIIVNGQNYHAEDIERVVQTVPGVRKGASVAIPLTYDGIEGLGVLAETRSAPGEAKEHRESIRTAVLMETGLRPRTVVML
jgi:fatty-acyl-CoA synthase